jgi:DNA-binding YbaB/EbfC family protein
MFGNLAEMAGLMKKAKDLQSNLKTIKAELAEAEVTAESGSGKVQVVAGCDYRIKKIIISPDCTGDVEILEELVAVAVNNALDKIKLHTQSKMSDLTGGLNIPGLF